MRVARVSDGESRKVRSASILGEFSEGGCLNQLATHNVLGSTVVIIGKFAMITTRWQKFTGRCQDERPACLALIGAMAYLVRAP